MLKIDSRRRADGFLIQPKKEHEILKLIGGRLPSCIAQAEFTPDGFVLEAETKRKLVPVYLSGGSALKAAKPLFISLLKEQGFYVLDSEAAVEECITNAADGEDRSKKIGNIVRHDLLIPHSKAMIALLDGNDEHREQTAMEVFNMADNFSPVVGISLTEKQNENKESEAQIQLDRLLDEDYFGVHFDGSGAISKAHAYLERLHGEILNPSHVGEARHRNSRMRWVQTAMANRIPELLGKAVREGLLPGTKIETIVNTDITKLQADDITLSQLQMTDFICKTILAGEPFPGFTKEYILTSLLNGADGPIARKLDTVSKEGGIKDATVDRLSEIMIVRLLFEKLGLEPESVKRLQVSFQLSTLTKAACEMSGVKTKEGGKGGMINRRIALYFILKDLLHLSEMPEGKVTEKASLTRKIKIRLADLVIDSNQSSKKRIQAMHDAGIRNIQAPVNPSSSGASEARKYTGIVLLNNRIGVDIVGELNKLTTGTSVVFPSAELLRNDNQYIEKSMSRAKGFLDEALSIAGL